MKVMFIVSQLGGGGAERVISVLANRFVDIGWDVDILMVYRKPIVYELNEKINLTYMDSQRGRFIGSIEQIFSLHKFCKKSHADVFISFLTIVNMVSILANIGNNTPLIISERNDPYQKPKAKWLRSFRNFLYRFAEGNVFQTPDAKEYFEKKGIKNGIVIPNPLKENIPERFNGIRKKVFVTAVRLEEQKNLPLLIKSFKRIYDEHPQFSLLIYGDGPDKNSLIELCKELNLKSSVEFKGFSKSLHSEIIDSFAFVLPSNYEGLSNSMLEALALGIPTISTDHPIGGARMFIKNGVNGILIPVNDETSMISAMEYLIDNPDKADLFSQNAIAIRKQLSVEAIAAKWINYINNVIDKGVK